MVEDWREVESCHRCEKQPEFCTCVARADFEVEQVQRTTEREAWARLVKADGAIWLAMMREEDRRPAMEERDAAKQALRDLGVDVDALLSE